jgi:hypothetical protein
MDWDMFWATSSQTHLVTLLLTYAEQFTGILCGYQKTHKNEKKHVTSSSRKPVTRCMLPQ